MKREFLIYIFIGLTVVFLGLVVFLTWKNKSTGINSDAASQKDVSATTYPKTAQYQVPILMYHYIRDASGENELGQNLSVHPDNFALQMKWLSVNNYATLKLSDLADPNKKEISQIIGQNQKPIILTFDDGYEDAYTYALPVLKENNMTGTFFIIRDFVGRAEYMNQNQIDKMQSAGMEIGSHSLSHPSLEKLSAADQRTQIFDSKDSAKTFCYPAGKFNDTTVKLVEEAGYIAAVTTQAGIANQDSNLLELPRVRIQNGNGEYLKGRLQ